MTGQRGSTLVIAVVSVLLLSVLALGLSLITSTEMIVAGSYANAQELTYAAESGLVIAEQELRFVPDWNTVLGGLVPSAWIDGDPARPRQLADGAALSLLQATNLANCGKSAPCSAAEMDATSDVRPWGRNNPRWQLFAYGALGRTYVAAWVADDGAEKDDDPARDEAVPDAPGAGLVRVRAEAFGVAGAHRVVEATVRRIGAPQSVARLSWAQIR